MTHHFISFWQSFPIRGYRAPLSHLLHFLGY